MRLNARGPGVDRTRRGRTGRMPSPRPWGLLRQPDGTDQEDRAGHAEDLLAGQDAAAAYFALKTYVFEAVWLISRQA
jgi:hypothetical protein